MLYTFKSSPFKDSGDYSIGVSDEGFTPLPTQKMGRTYTIK